MVLGRSTRCGIRIAETLFQAAGEMRNRGQRVPCAGLPETLSAGVQALAELAAECKPLIRRIVTPAESDILF